MIAATTEAIRLKPSLGNHGNLSSCDGAIYAFGLLKRFLESDDKGKGFFLGGGGGWGGGGGGGGGLTKAEFDALSSEDISIKSCKALLIREHSDVQGMHTPLTANQLTHYMYTQINNYCIENNCDKFTSEGQIPAELKRQMTTFSGLAPSTFSRRIHIVLTTDLIFGMLLKVLEMNRLYQLKGQKKPVRVVLPKKKSKKKGPKPKEVVSSGVDEDNPKDFPIGSQEKLFNSLPPQEVYEVLQSLIQQDYGLDGLIKEIETRVNTKGENLCLFFFLVSIFNKHTYTPSYQYNPRSRKVHFCRIHIRIFINMSLDRERDISVSSYPYSTNIKKHIFINISINRENYIFVVYIYTLLSICLSIEKGTFLSSCIHIQQTYKNTFLSTCPSIEIVTFLSCTYTPFYQYIYRSRTLHFCRVHIHLFINMSLDRERDIFVVYIYTFLSIYLSIENITFLSYSYITKRKTLNLHMSRNLQCVLFCKFLDRECYIYIFVVYIYTFLSICLSIEKGTFLSSCIHIQQTSKNTFLSICLSIEKVTFFFLYSYITSRRSHIYICMSLDRESYIFFCMFLDRES